MSEADARGREIRSRRRVNPACSNSEFGFGNLEFVRQPRNPDVISQCSRMFTCGANVEQAANVSKLPT